MTQVLDLADISGLDVAADGSMISDDGYGANQDPFYYDEGYDDYDSYPGYMGAYEGQDGSSFFEASEAEIEQWSKGLAKQDRKRRNVGLKILIAIVIIIVLAFAAGVFAYTQGYVGLKVLVAIVLLVVVAFGAAVFLYTQGYGYPTQESVAQQLFADPDNARANVIANGVSDESAASMLDPVVQDANVQIDGVNRSMSESTVYVTAQTPEGGDVDYRITMVRDMIGWKISNIELYFPSQG